MGPVGVSRCTVLHGLSRHLPAGTNADDWRASTRPRRILGEACLAARPGAIYICCLLVIAALLGCGSVTHIDVREAPSELANAETIPGKAPQALRREDRAPRKAANAPVSRSEENATMPPAAANGILADAPPIPAGEEEANLVAAPVSPAEVGHRLGGAPTAFPQEQEAASPPAPTLSETPSSVSPREESIEPAPRPACVTFVSTPPGATVVVNGRNLRGTTPLDHRSVPPGSSKVQF